MSDSLLLFNEVLNKGFDGNHFITGLSMHLRDLLVSKDDVTLPLLQVGASIRERYRAQAQKCPVNFLYRAMKLCNDCDLNYRTSKNKRLLVELTLIQAAQITAETDDVSGGRGPKQTLKPIFTQAAAQPQQQATPAAPRPMPQPKPAAPQAQQPATTAPAPNAAPVHAAPTGLLPQQTEEKKIPTMKKSGLGISIKHAQTTEPQKAAAPVAAPKTTAIPDEDYMFNERDVNYYWQEYAGRMPQEQVALAKRMQTMHVKLINSTTFEAVVDNGIIAQEFNALVPSIQNYLRTSLKNRKVTMTVRVSAPEEKTRAYSKAEKFQMMNEKNDALQKLKERFGLEFY